MTAPAAAADGRTAPLQSVLLVVAVDVVAVVSSSNTSVVSSIVVASSAVVMSGIKVVGSADSSSMSEKIFV